MKNLEKLLVELKEIVSVGKLQNGEIELSYDREDFAILRVEKNEIEIVNDIGFGVGEEIDYDNFKEILDKYEVKLIWE